MYWEDELTEENSARARLRTAQRMLFRTMLRLKVMQRERRERRDRGELRRAQAAYSEAEAEVRSAWLAWRGEARASMGTERAAGASPQAQAQVRAQETASIADQEPEVEPAALRRLHFARWLVARGVLSEWPEESGSPAGAPMPAVAATH